MAIQPNGHGSMRSVLSGQYHRLRDALSFYWRETTLPSHLPRGHFYSPLPATDTVVPARSPQAPFPDLDLNEPGQKQFLDLMIAALPEVHWPKAPAADHRFYFDNGYFQWADAMALFTMLRKVEPKRVIEVGSGFSSALML